MGDLMKGRTVTQVMHYAAHAVNINGAEIGIHRFVNHLRRHWRWMGVKSQTLAGSYLRLNPAHCKPKCHVLPFVLRARMR